MSDCYERKKQHKECNCYTCYERKKQHKECNCHKCNERNKQHKECNCHDCYCNERKKQDYCDSICNFIDGNKKEKTDNDQDIIIIINNKTKT